MAKLDSINIDNCSINSCQINFSVIEMVDFLSINMDDVNLNNLSLFNDRNKYLMIDKDIFNKLNIKYNIIFNRINDIISKNMIISILHYNRLLHVKGDNKGYTTIKINVDRLYRKQAIEKNNIDEIQDTDINDDTIVWYWKASNKDGWNEYPQSSQENIETTFTQHETNPLEQNKCVLINQQHKILFDCGKVVLFDEHGNIHNISNIK